MKPWLKWVLIVVGAVFAFFVGVMILAVSLVLFTDTDDTASTIEPVEQVQAEEVATEEPVEEEVIQQTVMGEDLQVGTVIFKANKRSQATNVGGEWGVDSKGEFLVVNVSVTNKGDKAMTVDSSYFKLLSGNKVYEADSSAGIYANKKADFFYEEVNPDLTLTGYVVFDIPSELHNQDLTLQVQTGTFGTQTGVIELQ